MHKGSNFFIFLLTNTCYFLPSFLPFLPSFLILTILMGEKWYLIVLLICISLVISQTAFCLARFDI